MNDDFESFEIGKLEDKLEDCRDFVCGLVSNLYDEYDERHFEFCMEELCHKLGVKFPAEKKLLVKKADARAIEITRTSTQLNDMTVADSSGLLQLAQRLDLRVLIAAG